MGITIQANPQYLESRTGIYTAWDLRRFSDSDPPGPGVAEWESFRVIQRQAGANMSVDIGKTAVGLMQGWVRGSTRGGQGLYRVDNIDTSQPTSDTYLAQLNLAISSNGSGNPRIDQVYLAIQDQQHAGASNAAIIDVAAGTPTGGATLDNRTGAASLPASAILLADIIINSGDATIPTAQIRDRRSYCLAGTVPIIGTGIDAVSFQPAPCLAVSSSLTITAAAAGQDGCQAAALMYLPRRIVSATKIRWRYCQGATANAGNYFIGLADSSGRVIAGTSTAFTGAASAIVEVSATITAQTFEPGWYYVVIGIGAMTASSVVAWLGADTSVSTTKPAVMVRNAGLRIASGGSTAPTTILGFTDIAGVVAATNSVPVPAIALSVG